LLHRDLLVEYPRIWSCNRQPEECDKESKYYIISKLVVWSNG